ncbi:SAM-dependent methyltransferase [Streptomyces xiaopingdaonensis]|uniref:SAM-dependent methyltransferase n=1 Tax=Streptomyces xiaopingdaonensis TaxID=1565415 RepID=UPI0002FFF42C|nr:SAM-dependent methyltransferase [Streptomyces xiaopingdaonensis]
MDAHTELGQDRAHSARMYDYYLGGKTNYRADREAAAGVLKVYPGALVAARENRGFMHRATRYAAEELGIRQFLDIGTGIPTEPNLYQVAHRSQPDARVVYTDNDPIVLAYDRALLTAGPPAAISYIDADVRAPETILERAAETLDFDQPVALSLVALLHFIPRGDDPHGLVARLVERLATGSLLVLSHATTDFDLPDSTQTVAAAARAYEEKGLMLGRVTREEMGAFFEGLELVAPGLVPTSEWRPDLDLAEGLQRLPGMISPDEVGVWAGVGRKP